MRQEPANNHQLHAEEKTTTSSSSSGDRAPRRSRRGSRRRQEPEGSGLKGDTSHLWKQAEADADDVPDGPGTEISRTNPDSAFGLARYWADACLAKGWLTGRKERIVRKHMALWRRAGASADTIRAMVDLFVADPEYANTDHRWKRFVANAESLQSRVQARDGFGRDETGEHGDDGSWIDRLPADWREELLAEAEDVA